ncbi:MAG: hypothetical protein ACLQUY_20770 [Ktedonobacterales bacterium]
MASNMNSRQVVVEDIGRLMQVGKPVFDNNKKKVGEVKQFDLTAGYMQVQRGGMQPQPQMLYIPFNLIEGIDPRDIFLSSTDDAVVQNCAVLPTSQVVLEQWRDWRTGRVQTLVAHEMRSGYSGQPVMAFPENYRALGQQLQAGMSVQDISGSHVGKITQFDSSQGWLNVEKGAFGANIMVVPFSAIQRIDTSNNTVMLLVPKEALQNDLASLVPSSSAADTTQRSPNA